MSAQPGYYRHCPSQGCRYGVLYPGSHCPDCRIPTVALEPPEPAYPPQYGPMPGPRRPFELEDVPALPERWPVVEER